MNKRLQLNHSWLADCLTFKFIFQCGRSCEVSFHSVRWNPPQKTPRELRQTIWVRREWDEGWRGRFLARFPCSSDVIKLSTVCYLNRWCRRVIPHPCLDTMARNKSETDATDRELTVAGQRLGWIRIEKVGPTGMHALCSAIVITIDRTMNNRMTGNRNRQLIGL